MKLLMFFALSIISFIGIVVSLNEYSLQTNKLQELNTIHNNELNKLVVLQEDLHAKIIVHEATDIDIRKYQGDSLRISENLKVCANLTDLTEMKKKTWYFNMMLCAVVGIISIIALIKK